MTSKETKLRKAVVTQLKDIIKRVGSRKLGEYSIDHNVHILGIDDYKIGNPSIQVTITADILT